MLNTIGSRAGRGRASRAGVSVGQIMLFAVTNPPPGWTKLTTHNDKMLRVVSGTASSGGTNTFSANMTTINTGATTLSTATLPAHGHADANPVGTTTAYGDRTSATASSTGTPNSGNTGGGGSHLHSADLRVQYVDVIMAQKN